jgi:hypothetical protein
MRFAFVEIGQAWNGSVATPASRHRSRPRELAQ